MKAKTLWVKYEYGKNVASQMRQQASSIPGLVRKDNPCLRTPSVPVEFPLSSNNKYAIYQLIQGLDRNNCPSVLESLSAPIIGHNIKAVALHMDQRSSHMRNVNNEMGTIGDKIILMINPVVEPEPHAKQSVQYEFNFLDGKNCEEIRLVKRRDFVNVKFQSIISDSGSFSSTGQIHHMILPMRESRLL